MAYVSYSKNEICKSAILSHAGENFCFGSGLDSADWQRAVWYDDILLRHTECKTDKIKFAILQSAGNIIIGFKIFSSKSERSYQQDASVWSGDLVELHFGAISGDPWLLQLALGINGSTFDSSGSYDLWQAKVWDMPEYWGGEVMIPLTMLQIADCAVYFNFCGEATFEQKFSFSWSDLLIRFHEVENFGLLLFTGYKEALRLRYGILCDHEVERKEYETLQKSCLVPAQKITHGPYILYENSTSVAIQWETAGLVPAFLEYRPVGSSDVRRVFCDKENAVMKHSGNHYALLTGLIPGAEYEYELFSLAPVSDKITPSGTKGSFRIPETDCGEFSFYCVSDLHSNAGFLNCAMQTPEAQSSALTVLLGDNLSHAAGREALYRGVIDPITEAGCCAPLLSVRGNHEQLGVFACEYFNVFPSANGKSYRFCRYGECAFIILDSGSDTSYPPERVIFDNPAMLEEQRQFLQTLVTTPEYLNAKARIVLMHIPPVHSDIKVEVAAREMLLPLREAEKKPDLMLCGHIHQYLRIEAGAQTYTPDSAQGYVSRRPDVMPLPFPVIICDTTMGLACQVSEKSLTVKAMRPLSGNEVQQTITFDLK